MTGLFHLLDDALMLSNPCCKLLPAMASAARTPKTGQSLPPSSRKSCIAAICAFLFWTQHNRVLHAGFIYWITVQGARVLMATNSISALSPLYVYIYWHVLPWKNLSKSLPCQNLSPHITDSIFSSQSSYRQVSQATRVSPDFQDSRCT